MPLIYASSADTVPASFRSCLLPLGSRASALTPRGDQSLQSTFSEWINRRSLYFTARALLRIRFVRSHVCLGLLSALKLLSLSANKEIVNVPSGYLCKNLLPPS